jgi:uncharacterized protein (TIGR02246 family)
LRIPGGRRFQDRDKGDDQDFNLLPNTQNMKKLLTLIILAAGMFPSCQTRTPDASFDMNEATTAVIKVLDTHWSAVKANDADAVVALLTDDALSCGSDSREFWSKTDIYNAIRQTLADTSLKIDIKIDKRVVRIAKDGNSAIALEQMFLKPYSERMPVRNIYHLVKTNNVWKIDFTSVSFIPDNDDIEKINRALGREQGTGNREQETGGR